MGCMILSSGRSGTNLLLSMLSNHKFFVKEAPYPEDKYCWLMPESIKPKLTRICKSDTHYITNFFYLERYLKMHPEMKILWMLRNPKDWCMSKIRRGYERDSYDATFEGCVADMFHMFRLYKQLEKYMPSHVMPVKMEDLIMAPKEQLKIICNFLQVNYTDDLLDFESNATKKNLTKRYKGLDKSQIGLYKNWETAYDGFLTKIDFDMLDVFKYMEPLIEYFGYKE